MSSAAAPTVAAPRRTELDLSETHGVTAVQRDGLNLPPNAGGVFLQPSEREAAAISELKRVSAAAVAAMPEDQNTDNDLLRVRRPAPRPRFAVVFSVALTFAPQFLRARDCDIEATTTMMTAFSEWRRTHLAPRGISGVTVDDVRNELRTGKAILHKTDRFGRPCVYVRANRHDPSKHDRAETERFTVYMLERTIAAVTRGVESFVVIFELEGFSRSAFDLEILKFIIRILSNNYPERLGALWFVNESWVFWLCWKLVSPFIPPATKDKIFFLGTTYREVLGRIFRPEDLLEAYGGTDTYSYTFEGYLPGAVPTLADPAAAAAAAAAPSPSSAASASAQ
jgi:hypothetical protein